ncbi:SDR family oxidoreductase [Oricola sp.]|uniref:SDR family oxidoreductase n=1 Tax=Oricola sp. TaxID=1979950 RepID=UPI0025F75357|nr:SDR family oxidoreductase [Oricola sp.]MCI5077276.1 SDR family oxidoreductase [Oricola sp.]
MDLGLKGRKAIVCASSRGLGRGCAVALADEGVELVINGRNPETTNATADELRSRGVKVTVVLGDVSDPAIQAELLAACPNPDILVNNNAGPALRDFRELDREAILAGVTQNMVTPIEMIQKVIDGMTDRGFGRIVNITSMSVYQPILGLDLSSGARAGLTSFLAGIARSVIDRNVTINNILPGKFDTDRIRATFKFGAEKAGTSIDAERDRQSKLIPAQRLGDPDEFGRTCAFLCSTHAGYLTGQNIKLDGGLFPSAF